MVSAITQTPASGPFGPVTTPPMSSSSMATAICRAPSPGCNANPQTAKPPASAPRNAILLLVIFSSP